MFLLLQVLVACGICGVAADCAREQLNEDIVSMLQVKVNQRKGHKVEEHMSSGSFSGTADDLIREHMMLNETLFEESEMSLKPKLEIQDMRLPTAEEKQEFLDATNKYRCMHGAPPLTWNDDLAAVSNKYITPMTVMKHSTDHYDLSFPRGPAGENLAIRSRSQNGQPVPVAVGSGFASSIVHSWYKEVVNCESLRGNFCEAAVRPSSSFTEGKKGPLGECCCPSGQKPKVDSSGETRCMIGHFTALIWKGATTLGCAFSKSQSPLVIICRYGVDRNHESSDIPNMRGYYSTNVLPTNGKTEAQCSAKSSHRGAPKPSSSRHSSKPSSLPHSIEGVPVVRVVPDDQPKKRRTHVAQVVSVKKPKSRRKAKIVDDQPKKRRTHVARVVSVEKPKSRRKAKTIPMAKARW
jgi:hypothetical protein